jgi:hypothetical protein
MTSAMKVVVVFLVLFGLSTACKQSREPYFTFFGAIYNLKLHV